MRLAVAPDEANSPLIVHPDAVLTSSIRLKCFQMIARRNTKILQPSGRVKIKQLAPADPFDCLKPEYRLVLEERLGVPASKRADQASLYDVLGIPSNGMTGPRCR